MKNQLSQITICVITLGLGITFALGVNSPARSQYVAPNDNDQDYQSGEKDSLYGDGITGINPMDLIHRANLSGDLSADEFSEQSQGQIQDSAVEFKRLQQERMLQQYRNQDQIEETVAE